MSGVPDKPDWAPLPPGLTGETVERWQQLAREAPAGLNPALKNVPITEQAMASMMMPAPDRLKFLLNSPQPMRLVRSLADAEFYMTVREIGPVDGLALLSLSSASQIEHLLDLEGWRRDRFDPDRTGAWIAVLLEGGEPVAKRLLRRIDDEVLILLFKDWARVQQVEYDDQVPVAGAGESEAGDERGFVSPDGYFRFSPARQEHAPAIRRLAEFMFREQGERYFRILWAAVWELASQIEEQALYWRNSRLEEHGYPSLDEALAVYSEPGKLNIEPERLMVHGPIERRPPVLPLALLGNAGFLPVVIGELKGADHESFLEQAVSLANHLLIADSGDTGDPEAHRNAMARGLAYVGLALEELGSGMADKAGTLVRQLPLRDLFGKGFAMASGLQTRARQLLRSGWASAHPRALELLDPPIGPRVAGLLRSRPMYYEIGDGTVDPAYRDFRSPGDIRETGRALDLAETVGRVFVDRLGLDISRVVESAVGRLHDLPRFSAILLTLMAWHSTRDQFRLEPLPADVVADFLRKVASRRTAPPEAASDSMERLMDTMNERLSLDEIEFVRFRSYGSACLEELVSECGRLDPGTPVDERDISCLLLQGEENRNDA